MSKAVVPFGLWEPDKAPYGHDSLLRADNVYPIANGYAPVGGWASATTALTGWNGGGAFTSQDGTTKLLSGTAAGLFSWSGSAWVEELAEAAGRWRFSQNRQLVVCVHGGAPVAYDLATLTAGPLGGSPPAAKYTATVGDFTWLAGDPDDVRTVSWSGFGNPEIWTPGTNQAGSLTLADGSEIMGLAGGDYLLAFQRGTIHRFDYIGGDTVWQRTVISREVGCIAPDSIVQAGSRTYFLSERGFMVCDGADVQPIGAERIDRTFFATDARNNLNALYAAIDPRHFTVLWSMPGNPGQAWLYNWALDRWANIRIPLLGVCSAFTSNIGVDATDAVYPGGVDGDASPLPVDSPIFNGGEPRIYYVAPTGALGTLTGPSLKAYFQTASIELQPGRFVRPFRARPMSDAVAGVSLEIDSRRRLGDGESKRTRTEMRRSGDMPVRANGRYMRFGLVIAAGQAWSYVQGVEVEAGNGGTR